MTLRGGPLTPAPPLVYATALPCTPLGVTKCEFRVGTYWWSAVVDVACGRWVACCGMEAACDDRDCRAQTWTHGRRHDDWKDLHQIQRPLDHHRDCCSSGLHTHTFAMNSGVVAEERGYLKKEQSPTVIFSLSANLFVEKVSSKMHNLALKIPLWENLSAGLVLWWVTACGQVNHFGM